MSFNAKLALFAILILAACTAQNAYVVRPEKLQDAAYFKGTDVREGLFSDWLSVDISAVDGQPISGPAPRASYAKGRPIEAGEHTVLLKCDGSESMVSYVAYGQMQMVFEPGAIYVVKARPSVDKVVFWLERQDTKEKVAEVTAPRSVRAGGTYFVPIVIKK